MKYRIEIEKAALKFISKQHPAQQKRIMEAVRLLPDTGDIVPFKGNQASIGCA